MRIALCDQDHYVVFVHVPGFSVYWCGGVSSLTDGASFFFSFMVPYIVDS